MLRTGAYSTSALPYGLLAQLFGSPTKSALEQAGQISKLIDFASINAASHADLIHFVQSVEASPPVVTVFRLSGSQGGAGYVRFASPYAPVFDVAV